MTRECMLRFIRHYKDTIKEKLAISISFCYKFIEVYMYAKNYQNRAWFDKVIAKIN